MAERPRSDFLTFCHGVSRLSGGRLNRTLADSASTEPVPVVGGDPAGPVGGCRFDLGGGRSVPLRSLCAARVRWAALPVFCIASSLYRLCCSTNACAGGPRVVQPSRPPDRGRRLIVMERDREQADLPTEQPPSGEDSRIPASDAHSRGPRHPAGPPAQGSHRTVGLSRLMLPAAYRLRAAADFTAVTRQGRRARSGGLLVYLLPGEAAPGVAASGAVRPAEPRMPSDQTASKAGLIVGRTVGGSVVRHRVSRRLRAQLATRLDRLPSGCQLVVRALPAAATESSSELARDLDIAVRRLTTGRSR